ncbi:hypothetical protein T459_14117 [Capsicum annuum]|uniref:Uncharacterized protein n=1 Tax=Capsicum annuum TaxID=4072 RepID=A0A2G2ZGI1_CAPAN|nr:hypothetical protein T459_14117 [Capsicum annuum]
MDDSDNESDNPITFIDIEDKLKDYSLSKLRSLTSVLIDYLNDLAKEKENINEDIEKYGEEAIEMSTRVAEAANKKEKLKEELAKCEEEIGEMSIQMTEQQATCNREGIRIQFQLEEELTHVKAYLSTSIDKNSFLEGELTKMKTKLEKALKWTVHSQAMTNPHSQEDGPISSVKLELTNLFKRSNSAKTAIYNF